MTDLNTISTERKVRRTVKVPAKAEGPAEQHAEGAVIPPEASRNAVLGFEKEPEMVIPVEKVAGTVPVSAETPLEDLRTEDLPADMDIKDRIAAIICVKKGKRDVPSEVKYYSKRSKADRVVIIDINSNLLREAWGVYKENSDDPDPEEFLATVLYIMKMGFPRIYRTVAPVVLD